jgi:hypothetical protein
MVLCKASMQQDGFFCPAQEPDNKSPVIVAGKDQGEADNDYLLIPVNILDHEGPLSASFPIENRLLPQGMHPSLPLCQVSPCLSLWTLLPLYEDFSLPLCEDLLCLCVKNI